MPVCELTLDAESIYSACIDLSVPHEESIFEIVCCLGSPNPTFDGAEQDAARVAVHRLMDELDLQIKDANYEDILLYKNLYNHLIMEHTTLYEKYNKLKWEYRLLKDSYNSVIIQSDEYVAERVRVRDAIKECHFVMMQLNPVPSATETDPLEGI